MDQVNFSYPYSPKDEEDHYENRLTWAFLALLKYDSHLQDFLRELVESRLPSSHREYREYNKPWERAAICTQTGSILSSTPPLVSLLLTDECGPEPLRVKWSDEPNPRVYDGVIEFPNRMTLIIENKPDHADVRVDQLWPTIGSLRGDIVAIVRKDREVLLDTAICLEWSELLEGVLRYANSRMASGDARELALDFLSFVETNHPQLTPYRTFALCGDSREALRRRISRLTYRIAARLLNPTGTEFVIKNDEIHRTAADAIVQRVSVDISEPDVGPWRLRVSMWPASTARQADRFRDEFKKDNFLSLTEANWTVEPNLNFSARRHNFPKRINSPCGTQEYLEYFFQNPDDDRPYGRKQKSVMQALIRDWEDRKIICPGDREDIEQMLTKSEYLDVKPEFSVHQDLDRDTVNSLEKQQQLEQHIIDALATPLATWNEHLPWRPVVG